MKQILAIALLLVSAACWEQHARTIPPIYPVRGAVVIYSTDACCMVVSEGFVAEAYLRWGKYLTPAQCQQRLWDLSISTNVDGTWTVRKSGLWRSE